MTEIPRRKKRNTKPKKVPKKRSQAESPGIEPTVFSTNEHTINVPMATDVNNITATTTELPQFVTATLPESNQSVDPESKKLTEIPRRKKRNTKPKKVPKKRSQAESPGIEPTVFSTNEHTINVPMATDVNNITATTTELPQFVTATLPESNQSVDPESKKLTEIPRRKKRNTKPKKVPKKRSQAKSPGIEPTVFPTTTTELPELVTATLPESNQSVDPESKKFSAAIPSRKNVTIKNFFSCDSKSDTPVIGRNAVQEMKKQKSDNSHLSELSASSCFVYRATKKSIEQFTTNEAYLVNCCCLRITAKNNDLLTLQHNRYLSDNVCKFLA